MKLFISYCDDGEGLGYAKKAKEIFKRRDIDAWVWQCDSSYAEWLQNDIAKNIESCNAMLTIITAGTENSEPQKYEWSLASSLNKINVSIRKEALSIPLQLRSRTCPEFNDNSFEKICNKAIDDIVEYLQSARPIQEEDTAKVFQVSDIAKNLEKRQEGLNERTVEEFGKSVWEGYLGSAVIRNIVRLAEASEEDKGKLRNIVIYSSIDSDKINAKDYMWELAFKQLGREIATGEKRHLVQKIQSEIKETSESCNETDDELSIVLREIERLNSIGQTPDVILAPPSILKSFVLFFEGEEAKVDFTRELGSAAILDVKSLGKLRIYLLGQGILSNNVILFNKSSVLWKVAPNSDTGYALSMGIGRGIYPDKVKFIVGTTVRCVVTKKEGITRIPIVR